MKDTEQKYYALRLSVAICTESLLAEGYKLGLLPKNSLIDGKHYYGYGRQTNTAIWRLNKHSFEYSIQHSWGQQSIFVKHPEDDDGCELFVPFREVI